MTACPIHSSSENFVLNFQLLSYLFRGDGAYAWLNYLTSLDCARALFSMKQIATLLSLLPHFTTEFSLTQTFFYYLYQHFPKCVLRTTNDI